MTSVASLLRLHAAFAKAKPATIARLAKAGSVRVVDDGKLVLRAGKAQTHLVLVAEGALQLSHPAPGARREVLLGRIDAPTLFGDATLHGDGVWPVTGRAAEPSTLVFLPPNAVDAVLDDDAPVAAELYRAACRRHFRSILLRRALVLHGTAGQILELLARQRSIAWTPTTLGRSLGVDRTTIWRQLKKLAQDGVIVVDENGRPRLAE